MTPSKQPGRKTRRGSSSKRPSNPPQPARKLAGPAGLSEEWWHSWQRANALGWEYLNALSGLFRLPFTAMTGASRFMSPFHLP